MAALKYNAPLVDNESVFRALAKENPGKNYFAPDRSHCNAEGYGVMAKNVYDVIVKNDIIRPKDQ
jgi:lysophospholipase L1-like esterase